MEKKAFIVDSDTNIIKFLQNKGYDFVFVKKLLRQKDVKINSVRTNKNLNLKHADKVEVYIHEAKLEPFKIDKAYEDESVLIVYKMPHIETCGINGLEGKLGVLPVHRLDRNTEGLIIFAKTEQAKADLENCFRKKLVTKNYLCEVYGDTNFSGEVKTAYLYKDAKASIVRILDTFQNGSVEIKTKFTTIHHGLNRSVVECGLLTGKTHQIRAHLAHLGHFIIGDNKYGDKSINRFYGKNIQTLSCFEISFPKLEEKNLQGISGKTFKKFPTWYKQWTN